MDRPAVTLPATPLSLHWERRDRHRLITVTGLLGLLAAGGLALWGLPPMDLHGPFHRFGIMDPLCGGTRAAWYTVQGRLGTAFSYNPLGPLAVAAAAVWAARTVIGLTSRRWLNVRVHLTRRGRRVLLLVGLLALLALEVRQQMIADLLMEDTAVWV